MEKLNETKQSDIYKTLRGPLEAQIELTSACNNACIHCYNYWRGINSFHQSPHLFRDSALQKEQIVALVETLAQNKVLEITFTGGEPLLYSAELIEGIKTAKSLGVPCSVNTNLTMMTLDLAHRLKEIGVDSVLASLSSFDNKTHDGITQRQGSFERTTRGIEYCLNAGLDTTVNMVIMQANHDQVLKTGKFVKSLGIDSFTATKAAPCMGGINFSEIVIDEISFHQMLEDLVTLEQKHGMKVDSLTAYPLCALRDWGRYKKIAERNCGAGVTTCTFGANGEIRPCSFSDEIYGNFLKESFDNIWKRMRDWRDGSRLPKKCLYECEFFPHCGGGCRMEAKYSGQINAPDPMTTSPLDVINIPKSALTVASTDFQQRKFQLADGLKFRQEDFGGILVIGSGSPIFLNKAGYEMFQQLAGDYKPIIFQEIQHRFNLSLDSMAFFAELESKGLLKPVNE